jgi:[acyl-carrier-protein] S-malonyltransferase
MMKDISEKYPEAKDIISRADSVLGYSLSSICFEGPLETLKETRYTQPALFLHGAVVIDLLKNKLNFDAVAGHSVGEYAALYAAGVISFEDALKLVSLRGNLMYKAGEYLPGTMFAVIGLDEDIVIDLCSELSNNSDGNVIVAANFNSPGQVVISGSAEYLRQNATKFKEAGAKMITELVVSGAFHSPLMEPARNELAKAIDNIKFNEANVPIYSNVFAKPLTNSNELKDALIKQLTSPVKWTQSMQEMQKNSIDNFIEIGPGKVLQGLVKRTLKDIQISGIDKVEEVEKHLGI